MLTELAIKHAKAKDKDYKLSDSEGLYLYVTKAGHRSWRLKYRFAGKERRLILGSWPDVSLADARRRKNSARASISEGRDPGLAAQLQKVERSLAAAPTHSTPSRALGTSFKRTAGHRSMPAT